MNVKRGSTTFLKVIIISAGIAVLALCIFLVPHMANFAAKLYPNIALMKSLVFIDDVRSGCAFLLCSLSGF